MPAKCPSCGALISSSSRPGRPRRFCSTGCKRASEREAGRINDRLKTLEWQRVSLSLRAPGELYLGDPTPEALDRAIESERRRLVQLLDDDDPRADPAG